MKTCRAIDQIPEAPAMQDGNKDHGPIATSAMHVIGFVGINSSIRNLVDLIERHIHRADNMFCLEFTFLRTSSKTRFESDKSRDAISFSPTEMI